MDREIAEREVRVFLPCRCDAAYTERGLTAPDCPWHNAGEDIVDLIQRVAREERERFAVLFDADRIVSGSIGPLMDVGYNMACQNHAQALRAEGGGR